MNEKKISGQREYKPIERTVFIWRSHRHRSRKMSVRPSKKMLDLDATLQETEELLRSSVEEGLLTDESFLRDTHIQLSVYVIVEPCFPFAVN